MIDLLNSLGPLFFARLVLCVMAWAVNSEW